MAKHTKTHKAGVFKGGINPRLVSENKRSPKPPKKPSKGGKRK